MMSVPLSAESTPDAPVAVEVEGERSDFFVTIRVATAEGFVLMPDEALAVAAALRHYAHEVVR